MNIITSGESHGKGLFAVIEGLPAGLKLDPSAIDAALLLRQSGYGRGGRQKIEQDRAEILTGVRDLVTLGSPVTVAVRNRDYENWKEVMAPEGCDVSLRRLTCVRPGHADYAGAVKFGFDDARNVLERASARETAVRVAAGEICRTLLRALGIEVGGYVRAVGRVVDTKEYPFSAFSGKEETLGMLDPALAALARAEIDAAAKAGDTLGGVVEVRVRGLKCGFGSYTTYAGKLDARLAMAVMSIQAAKGVQFGLGFGAAALRGSEVHDEIFSESGKIFRKTNRAGGIEGGVSNGEEIVLSAAMKPIPTLGRGLRTVDLVSGAPAAAASERSDVCAVKAFEVIAESAVASEIARVVCERLGGDTMADLLARYERLPS